MIKALPNSNRNLIKTAIAEWWSRVCVRSIIPSVCVVWFGVCVYKSWPIEVIVVKVQRMLLFSHLWMTTVIYGMVLGDWAWIKQEYVPREEGQDSILAKHHCCCCRCSSVIVFVVDNLLLTPLNCYCKYRWMESAWFCLKIQVVVVVSGFQ